MIDDARLYAAILGAVDPVVRAARRLGPLPGMRSEEFLMAPAVVQRAILLVCGEAWVVGESMVDEVANADLAGGKYHRPHHFPAISELGRRRYPPTGDRQLWIEHGPAGPPGWRDEKSTLRRSA